jgi:hypothetical protein
MGERAHYLIPLAIVQATKNIVRIERQLDNLEEKRLIALDDFIYYIEQQARAIDCVLDDPRGLDLATDRAGERLRELDRIKDKLLQIKAKIELTLHDMIALLGLRDWESRVRRLIEENSSPIEATTPSGTPLSTEESVEVRGTEDLF